MSITEYLKEHILILDGGTGTLLQQAGLSAGESPEQWNLTHREQVKAIARAYYDAGSNLVCTNTFGANLLHCSKEELAQIIPAAVQIVREAQEESTGAQEKFIALDVGPSGRLLKPLGDLEFEDAVSLFSETVRLGAACGVDVIFIETMNDSYETKAALLGAKEACDLPVFVSNAYGSDGRLLNGADPEAMATLLEGLGADAIGANCSLGPDQLSPVISRLCNATSLPVLFKPNAGLPHAADGKTVFDVSPQAFAQSVAEQVKKGVHLVGGCCGTTPEYIACLTEALKGLSPLPLKQKDACRISSYTHSVSFGSSPVLIGERINPTGKKRFQQALREGDMNYVLQEGLRQQEKGVHVLDVNVGLPDLDETSLLPETVRRLQEITDLPLQIDTADPVAMEGALRCYNGCALLNSVNGKKASMSAIFPLQKKYGGVAIALTLDESGIPSTAEGRVSIAEKICRKAEEYGIGKDRLIFDPLAMTVSADQTAATVTLETLERLRAMGCRTSLGVSNVSFGLPARDTVNAVFFALALERGLNAAIMNPHSEEMMTTYHAFRLLHGMDENCGEYLTFAKTLTPCTTSPSPTSSATVTPPSDSAAEDLSAAIRKGLKEQARRLAAEEVCKMPPLEVVSQSIVPALNEVGQGFEEKTVFLPQLLMSAEAAKEAFEEVKNALLKGKTDAPPKGPVILATVKGDVHDIGKNIVRLLLENYGFSVMDLGKDVPPEAIVTQARNTHAPLVALSALMTTTVPAMEETIRLIREENLPCKVLVGGAVLNEAYAEKIGADAYGKDAMEAVRRAQELIP